MKYSTMILPWERGHFPSGIRWMLIFLLWGTALTCSGQSTVYFKSGAQVECRILKFENGIFMVEFPDGTRKVTRQENILRIEFQAAPKSTPAEWDVFSDPEPSPVPAPTPPVAPPPPKAAVTVAAPEPVANSRKMVLTTHWQYGLGRPSLSLRDTARLLAKCGQAQIDLDGRPITIWGKITYLMPVEEAKKLLGLGQALRKPMTCEAFPPNSFFYHGFTGNYQDGFNTLYLITDYANQVVGIQWQDNTTRTERWFPYYSENYSEDWSLFNFVDNRKKGNPNWQIGFYVCKGSSVIMGYPPRGAPGNIMGGETGVNQDVVRIDSDLYSLRKDRWGITTDEKSRERIRLLLAQPVVDLMLYIVQQAN